MKKFFLLLFSIVSLGAVTHAQDSSAQKKAPAMQQQKTNMMQQLNLTDEQKAKFKKMREDEKTQIDSIQNSKTIPEDQKPAQIKAVRQNQRKMMEDMLTPDQKSKMMEMRSQQMGKRKSGKETTDSSQ